MILNTFIITLLSISPTRVLTISSEYKYFILASLLAGIVVGFTTSSIYESFGPESKNLRDPFEEHED